MKTRTIAAVVTDCRCDVCDSDLLVGFCLDTGGAGQNTSCPAYNILLFSTSTDLNGVAIFRISEIR